MSIIQESRKQREVLLQHSLVLHVDTSGIMCFALKGTLRLLVLCNSWLSNRMDSSPCYRAVNQNNPTCWFLIYGHRAGLWFWEEGVQQCVCRDTILQIHTKFLLSAIWDVIVFTKCNSRSSLQHTGLIQMWARSNLLLFLTIFINNLWAFP